jgi:hypothetical protein
MLSHRELLRAHRLLMERDIEPGVEIELGKEVIGAPIELDREEGSSGGREGRASGDSLVAHVKIPGNGETNRCSSPSEIIPLHEAPESAGAGLQAG